MDQWNMARAAAAAAQQQQQQQQQPQQVQQQVQQQQQQQQVQQQQQAAHVPQQGVASQYSYSGSSYSGQQAGAPVSAASVAYGQPQAYAQQGYAQQAYQQPTAASAQAGYASTATYGTPAAAIQQAAQQQQLAWSQQASAQGAQQADAQQGVYGRASTGVASVPASGASANAASQYGGQYGAVYANPTQAASQQVLGASGRSTEDYQSQIVASRGSTAYGAPQDSRATIGSGASYVVGGAPTVNASGVYGASDATKYAEVPKYGEAPKYGEMAKYGDNAKYAGSASTVGYGGKASEYGGAASPTDYSQKTTADQYGASYNMKAADYGVAERGHYGQAQNAYGQADSRADAVRGYQDAHAVTATAQQRQQQQDRQNQQNQLLLQQQQALQAQQLQQQALQARGAATSPLEGATRTQGDYLGRGAAVRTGDPRGMVAGNYGANRAEAELVAQYGGAGGGRNAVAAGGGAGGGGGAAGYGGNQQASVYGGMSGGRGPAGQMYGGLGAPAMGYGGVQLPPGRDYSAGRGTGGGGFPVQREGSYGGGRSDRPSIGSSRNDDRRDPRPPFRSGGGDRRYDDANRRNSRDINSRDSISRDSISRDSRDGRDRGRSNTRMPASGGRGPAGGGGPYDRDDRDRGRDRDRDRRDDDRKRDRSPGIRSSHDRKMSPAGDRDDRSRKDSPRRDSYRHASPSKEKRREYVCKIEPYSLVDVERDYTSVSKRHSKLYVVPEFSKLVACWVNRDVELSLNKPISFEHDAVDIEDEGESTKEAPPPNVSDKALPSSASAITPSTSSTSKPALQTTVWNAKVMLMSGLTSEAYAEFLSDKSTEEKPSHIHNMLKFVALRKDRSAIMAAGGRWDEELDGGDPTNGDSALIRAAIRCTKDSTQLDLSACKTWSRIVEVHYERLGEDGLPSHKEITVMYLPSISDCIPSVEVWQAQWKARQQAKLESEAAAKKAKDASEKKMPKEGDSNGVKEEKEAVGATEEASVSEVKTDNGEKLVENQDKVENDPSKVVPEEHKELVIAQEEIPAPGLVLTTKRLKSSKMRSMTISLDGLLDYDEEDREECTFELSLFAEVLQELLQYKMGNRILSNLEAIREETFARRKEEKKRKQENEKEVDAEGSSSQRKRSKFSDKPDNVEVKVELDVKPNSEVKTEGEPPVKVVEKVEENGSEGEKMEDNDIKKESLGGDSLDAAAPPMSAESAVKATELNGTVDLKEDLKDTEMTQPTGAVERQVEEEKPEERKVEKKVVVDQELLLAYRYFDKNRVGYLKSDDVRRLLHCLGKFLSHRNVKDMVGCAVSESSKSSRDDRIVYRIFTEKEVEVDMEAMM